MYPTMVLALGFAALKIFLSGGGAGAILPAVGGFLLALLPITGVYLFIYLIGAVRGTELIGFGDIKLGVVFALLASWSANILVLFIANVVGALVAVVLMIMKKKKLASVVAFGPFLIVAFVVVFLGNFSLLNFAPLML
jgi:prepilin signal peptidase PulO-like enzyme (type II secretory pathway)